MTIFLYDGSLEGYLSAIFEAYDRKSVQYKICQSENYAPAMFSEPVNVASDKTKAQRVWKGLKQRLSARGLDYIYCAHLSESAAGEETMLAFIRYVLREPRNIESDFSNADVLQISRISKMVHRERHRMKAFIRFQLTKDGIYYAAVEPDFNVLPLIITHFRNRYADQRWLIYDLKRKYGIYYDLHTVANITLSFAPGNNDGRDIAVSFDESEEWYRQLWKDYFKSATIATRKNTKLHLRHVPRRYWRLLTEKG